MTPDEAIESSDHLVNIEHTNLSERQKAGIKLGIAALYRIKYQRKKPTVPHKTLLPGETEEGS